MQHETLSKIRHSLAHILLQAVKHSYPHAHPTIGPVTDNGFYYDIDFGSDIKVGADDLKKLEATMHEIIKRHLPFTVETVTADQARGMFSTNPYKLEIIESIVKTESDITVYRTGEDFVDLCEGPHVANTREIPVDGFALTHIAGAYWRGDEKNAMLTRIYGIAFSSKEELDAYTTQQEEAKKRDHRILGKQLDLFTFSPLVGSGLPIWLPRGATIRRELERFIVDTELKWGYLHVYTPDIAKLDLYKTSGHYPYYKDSMYAPIKIDDDEFMLRPMTCPHHFQVYSDSPKSYKQLPMRIAELAKLYRYEASGELSGLVRVRGFCLADAHIICAGTNQAKDEVAKALDLIEHVSDIFGLTKGNDYWYRLSLGDRNNAEKYYKNDDAWDTGEHVLREVLKEREVKFIEAQHEAAFYGPKIDVQMKDVRGKENTAFTVQYDFCMPDRFNLTYTDSEGKDVRPIVVHRSSIGAIERVMAFLIEHYAGNFPLWLSPIQITVLPIADAHKAYASTIYTTLIDADIRAELDDSKEGLGKKIRNTREMKTPYWAVIGDAEVTNGTVTLEHRTLGKIGEIQLEDLVSRLSTEIKGKQ
jgi:threonyl-tRNA synthetase